MIGIYKITNISNHLCYIGQSRDLERRLKSHQRAYENSEIDNAIRCNPENFIYEIIEECTVDVLNDREIYWIQYYNSYYNGYNETLGGSWKYNPTKNSISLLSDNDIKLIRICYASQKYKSGAEVQREFFPSLDKHLIAAVYNGQLRLDIMPEVYQNYYQHELTKHRQLGELNPQSIVTEQDVKIIRVLYSITTRQNIINLFPQYKERTIVAILSGQNWQSLPIYHKREKRWTYPETWQITEITNFNIWKETIIKQYEH